ncbi:hypothetical protein FHX42_004357 [Saccharopolyspora lacisalsi]|uniref:Uncharacterized protein n=1 Tax=Halosaccharopolyspora lacisalsi TaxID=1000566 RepID=A0A839E114_9PSEU|nr:hypothetical protein [Halosaccharopolyspora lacisalsi]
MGVFALVVGVWLAIDATDSLIFSLTDDYEWHDSPSTLTFALWYTVDALHIVNGIALAVTAILLFARNRIAKTTAIISGSLPIGIYIVQVINDLQSASGGETPANALYWWPGIAWGFTCLIPMTLVFIPPVARTLHPKNSTSQQGHMAQSSR